MSSAKELFAKINNASASSHPLASLNLTGEFLAKDYNYKNATTFGSFTGSIKLTGGVLAPNGKIYGIPFQATTVLEIDPVTKTTTEFGSLAGTYKWWGGVLAPNGKIYGIPCDSKTVLEIDPVTKTTTEFGSLAGTFKWQGGVLAPNGKIYGIPSLSTTVLEIDTGCIGNFPWALQPYVNKYQEVP